MILFSVLTQMFALMEVLFLIMLVVAALITIAILIGVLSTTQMNSFLRKCAAVVRVVALVGKKKKKILCSVLTKMFAMMAVLFLIMLMVAALNTFAILIGVVSTTQMNSLLRICAAVVRVVMELTKKTRMKTKEKIK